MVQLMPIILMFGIFYFLLIRPQQKRQQEHKTLLGALKDGDRIVTNGGLHGRIVKVQDDILVVEIADRVRVKVDRSAVASVQGKGTPAKAEGGGKGNGKAKSKAKGKDG